MNARMKNLINVIATGIIVIVLFSLLLFMFRSICYIALYELMPSKYKVVKISPSGLVPGETEPETEELAEQTDQEEPNVKFSTVQADMRSESASIGAIGRGWLTKLVEMRRDFENSRFYYWWYENRDNFLCFDKKNGLIIYRNLRRAEKRRGEVIVSEKLFEYFIGPDGMSETASESLGRFYDPIITTREYFQPGWLGIYDKKLRGFYLADFAEMTVIKGPELAEGDDREPVEIGEIQKGFYATELFWSGPQVKNAEGEWERQRLYLPDDPEDSNGWSYGSWWSITKKLILTLDKTGRVYLLDTNDWSFKPAGYLPVPHSLFASAQQETIARPKDLLAYSVIPVYAILRSPAEPNCPRRTLEVKYLGTCAASMSGEGTSMAVCVFDPNGRAIKRADTESKGLSSAEMIYGEQWESFWAPVEYILENLQPVVFEVASYLSGDYFEASAGHRALFILPNSFLGMLGRAGTEEFLAKQLFALLLMGPSLILAVWLAWKIRKDAKLTGLSSRAGKWWIAGTIAFGLPAYITYRLTRTKETLVTCQNCGKMRRPDMERCHRCGSKWEIPELTPPNWRICN